MHCSIKKQYLLVTEVMLYKLYIFWSIFTLFISIFLLYFGEVWKFKVILKAKWAMSRRVRMCLAQPGYGLGLLPQVYYRPKNILLNFISVVLLPKYIFPILFFHLSKMFSQYYFYFYSVKWNFHESVYWLYFDVYLSKNWDVFFSLYVKIVSTSLNIK